MSLDKLLAGAIVIVLITVLGNTQLSYADHDVCTVTPNSVTVDLFPGESITIPKTWDCNGQAIGQSVSSGLACRDVGIFVEFLNHQTIAPDIKTFDEKITNEGGSPGTIHCQATYKLDTLSPPDDPLQRLDTLVQDIWVTTKFSVGGDIIPLDTTMVLAAGAQYTAAWMIPVLVSAIGIGIVISRKF